MNFAHCLYRVLVIGNYTDISSGDFSGGGGVVGKRHMQGSFLEEYFKGEEDFHEGGHDFPALFKHNQKSFFFK